MAGFQDTLRSKYVLGCDSNSLKTSKKKRFLFPLLPIYYCLVTMYYDVYAVAICEVRGCSFEKWTVTKYNFSWSVI